MYNALKKWKKTVFDKKVRSAMRGHFEQEKIQFELELNRRIRLRFKRQKMYKEPAGSIDIGIVQKKLAKKFHRTAIAQQVRKRMDQYNVTSALGSDIAHQILDHQDYGEEYREWKRKKQLEN